MPVDSGKPAKPSMLNSNSQNVYEDLQYSRKDIEHIEEWVKRHVETTWHSLGVSIPLFLPFLIPSYPTPTSQATFPNHTNLLAIQTCSMAPRNGNSIVKHGVLDERLNVHGVKNLKVADLSICPDNVGCNTYSTALLIGEKCAMLVAEDLGYSGKALEMKV
jgi:alcohol oxidase